MALKRCLTSHLLKRWTLAKLFFFLLAVLIVSYALLGGFHSADSKPFHHEEPTLRMHPETVVERRMLNADEDALESLIAPTTKAPRVGEGRHGVAGGLQHNGWRAQAGVGMDLSANGENAPAPAHIDNQLMWDAHITREKPNQNEERRMPDDVDVQPFEYNQYNQGNFNNQEGEREKVKQWETYDYENPNNLLQIHVDRAPEHSEGVGSPWPMPQSYLTEEAFHIVDMDNFKIISPEKSCDRVDRAVARYTQHIRSKIDLYIPLGEFLNKPNRKGSSLNVLTVRLSRPCYDKELPHEHMSEQYKLRVSGNTAELSAQEPWGVIRGLETFSQLIYYNRGYSIINTTHIKDYPRFRFRGLMLDTARHYIPIRNIKRTLDAMSYNKLNVFHWHIVDDQSFPYVSKVFPNLSKLGAYSSDQIYTPANIREIIDYAADRAIRVIPEFDTPGHTRSWGLGYPDLLTNCSPDYHPFGAVNPISNYTYEFMNKFWSEVHDLFPDSIVHVGGDEINYKCWLRLRMIREFMLENNMTVDQYDYITLDGDKLQGYYLKHLLEAMPRDRKKIAWEEAFSAAQTWNVSMDELIINVWKGGDYEWQYTMENVIRRGYKAVLSAPWYLNYISYGKDWTKYYEQDPHSFLTYAQGVDSYKDYVLGGQVCMWAEYIDETNLESTLWPRASSPAEKFWSSAAMNDWRQAETRFENHRCRMTRRGVHAQPISGPGSCRGQMRIKPPYEANTNF